ncbi:MAG: hypothetical protein HZB38_00030 [Planctomycetes bacterium]|nr:hypothetical protein [Planctomycetota bacterium]
MSCPEPNNWDFLAMNALDDSQAEALHAHAAVCASCRDAFLAARRAHVDRLRRYEALDTNHDRLREQLMSALPHTSPAGHGGSGGLRRLGEFVMSLNRPTSRRIAAVLAPAACIVIAAFFLLWPNQQRSAFASAMARLRAARTIVAHFEAYMNHSPTPLQSGTLYLSDEHGMRFEATADGEPFPGVPNVMGISMTHQPGGPIVMVNEAMKFAFRMHTTNGRLTGWSGGLDQSSPDRFLDGFRKLTGEADSALGRSTLDGREVEGFEISARKLGLEFPGSEASDDSSEPSRARIYVDAESHLPVRMEIEIGMTMPGLGAMHFGAVYQDFQFDQPLDPALFLPTIPDGLRVIDVNVPDPTEETLLNVLRTYAEATGRYPISLNPSRMSAELMITLVRQGNVPVNPDDPMAVLSSDLVEKSMQVAMGCAFVQQLAREDRDVEYFGDIVTPEDTGEVLLRWTLPDGSTRVIDAALNATTLAPEPAR